MFSPTGLAPDTSRLPLVTPSPALLTARRALPSRPRASLWVCWCRLNRPLQRAAAVRWVHTSASYRGQVGNSNTTEMMKLRRAGFFYFAASDSLQRVGHAGLRRWSCFGSPFGRASARAVHGAGAVPKAPCVGMPSIASCLV
jgi:hypothetical protein